MIKKTNMMPMTTTTAGGSASAAAKHIVFVFVVVVAVCVGVVERNCNNHNQPSIQAGRQADRQSDQTRPEHWKIRGGANSDQEHYVVPLHHQMQRCSAEQNRKKKPSHRKTRGLHNLHFMRSLLFKVIPWLLLLVSIYVRVVVVVVVILGWLVHCHTEWLAGSLADWLTDRSILWAGSWEFRWLSSSSALYSSYTRSKGSYKRSGFFVVDICAAASRLTNWLGPQNAVLH